MKILLLGANGQLGWQLRRSLSVIGTVTALTRGSSPWSGDLTQGQHLIDAVQAVGADVIVNAAAFTAVDRAQTEPEAAFAVNQTACALLARQAQRSGAWLVHYSTDYVFDGSGDGPWCETDAPAPINVYGHSKLGGELAVAQGCERHLIFRTSWVFDSWGQNFLKSILRAAAQRDSLNVVNDQWGAPTRAALIADVTAQVLRQLRPECSGLYHLAAAGATHWRDYAALAVGHAIECGMALRARPDSIHPIASSDYPVAAPRPRNSRLNTQRLRSTFNLTLPPWQDGVRAVVAELAALRRPL